MFHCYGIQTLNFVTSYNLHVLSLVFVGSALANVYAPQLDRYDWVDWSNLDWGYWIA